MSLSVPFSLRVRLGHCEVEISGSKDDVLSTLKDLSSLVAAISEAFSQVGGDMPSAATSPIPRAPIVETASSSPVSAVYPSIQSSGNCSDAVLKLLSTDWGRTTPRTLPELIEAMKSNAVHFPATTLSGVLNWLVRKGRVKRWKTEKGYVYVLAGPNVLLGQTPVAAQTQTDSGNVGGE